jgi:ubiquinone/menaquinone biosynthesis C-methylase UbiE
MYSASRRLLQFAFHLLYNPFAFTYDWVSRIVSRGRWRAWTNAAMPYLVGERVLDLPCGTGNLLLDLNAAGFAPIGVDLSPAMLHIAQKKLWRPAPSHPERNEAQSKNAPLLRARAQALPFAAGAFDSITMTFPPSFVYDPQVWAELYRVLRDHGRLIWVDGGRLKSPSVLDRWLNRAFQVVDGGDEMARRMTQMLARTDFNSRVEIIEDEFSAVTVVIATRRG